MENINYYPNPVPEDDADLRRYINDELQSIRDVFDNIYNHEDWHEVGAAGEPAFKGSWIDAGANPAFYLDSFGRVHLKGDLSTGTSGTIAFTLPSGYTPSEVLWFVILQTGGAAGASLSIATNGDVTIIRTASTVYINNVSFRI